MNSMINMVVFDIAGTTIQDNNEVENCFINAAAQTGLDVKRERVISMMGWSKIRVFETLWKEKFEANNIDGINTRIIHSYDTFKNLLESHYLNNEVIPTTGCIEIFHFLKLQKIKIVLNTGFYRKITDLLLEKIGWLKNGKSDIIDYTITSDEVAEGRPSPYMIFKAMELMKVYDVRKVIKIGDTPSDLAEGKNAGCLYSLGVLGGTHSYQQLKDFENDGIMENMVHFKDFLEERVFL